MYLTMYLFKKVYFMVISDRGRDTERPLKIMNNFNNNHKLILLGIIAVLIMFFSYNLYLSPYQKCVSGLIAEGQWREDALVMCKPGR